MKIQLRIIAVFLLFSTMSHAIEATGVWEKQEMTKRKAFEACIDEFRNNKIDQYHITSITFANVRLSNDLVKCTMRFQYKK